MVLMVWVPDMLPMVSKELGKAHFNAIMSWTMDVEQEAVTLVVCGLKTVFRGMISLGGKQCCC